MVLTENLKNSKNLPFLNNSLKSSVPKRHGINTISKNTTLNIKVTQCYSITFLHKYSMFFGFECPLSYCL